MKWDEAHMKIKADLKYLKQKMWKVLKTDRDSSLGHIA